MRVGPPDPGKGKIVITRQRTLAPRARVGSLAIGEQQVRERENKLLTLTNADEDVVGTPLDGRDLILVPELIPGRGKSVHV